MFRNEKSMLKWSFLCHIIDVFEMDISQTNNEADNFNEIEKNLNVQSSIEDIHIGEYLQMIQHWSLSIFIDYYDEM